MVDPVDVLARNIWGEGRSTGTLGMQRIANVHMNRVAQPSWWGHDIISVCLAPWQFSCRNADDPNLPKLLSVTSTDPEFRIALALAARAIAGTLDDLTGGADSYYAISMRQPPRWTAHPAVHTVSDHWHSFWRTRIVFPQGCVSHHAVPELSEADVLNQAELDRLAEN